MSTENLESIVESPEATAAELAKTEDVTAYVEERHEQEAEDAPKDETEQLTEDLRDKYDLPDKKKASRYERLKRARDQYRAENEDLRRQLGERETPRAETERPTVNQDDGALENSLRFAADKHGEEKFSQAFKAFSEYVQATGDKATYDKVLSAPDVGEALIEWHDGPKPQQTSDPYQAALEEGRQHANFEQALDQEREKIRIQTVANVRGQQFAQAYPDFYETMESVKGIETIPGLMMDLIKQSEFGPAICYWLAKDAFEVTAKSSN